jgi:hypothetical protein
MKTQASRAAPKRRVVPGAKIKNGIPDTVATRVLNGHWFVEVTRTRPGLVAEGLRPCHVIVQNHGPGTVKLVANDGDLMDLSPGDLRASYAQGSVRIEGYSRKPSFVELEIQSLVGK